MRGPIDYIIVGFEGNKFNGSILNEIGKAIDAGVIGLVALLFVQKDQGGSITVVDLKESDDPDVMSFSQQYVADSSLITDDDIDEVADLIENNTSVGLLVVEQLWAVPLKKALLAANGVLVAEGRIHPDAAAELKDEEDE